MTLRVELGLIAICRHQIGGKRLRRVRGRPPVDLSVNVSLYKQIYYALKLDMLNGAYSGKIVKWAVKYLLEITFIGSIILAMIVILSSSQSFILTPRAYLGVIILFLFSITFFVTHYTLSERIKNKKIEASSRPILAFFIWGVSLTSAGLVTTLFVMITNFIIDLTDTNTANNFKDIISFYAQISLNFILGGITLVGASLPLLPSLFGQNKGETTSTHQSSGESGDCQQSK